METQGSGLLEEFLLASPDALLVVDGAGTILTASDAVVDLFGYRPAELAGQPVEMLIPEASRERHADYRRSYTGHPEVRPMGVGLNLMGVRKDGTTFPVDVSLVPSRARGETRVGAFVRDATVRRQNEDLLRLVNEMSREALAGAPAPDLFGLTARHARTLVAATASWIAVTTEGYIRIAAADGPPAEPFMDVSLPIDETLTGQVLAGAGTLAVEDLSAHPLVIRPAREAGLGPGLYIPMLAERGPIGVLVVARGRGERPFTPPEIGIAEIFASATGVVLALGTARQALEDARVTAEHERIARDLHDTVIQRLFAMGMRLQAAERLAEGPIAERIGDTVENIDEVIREIRETIFDLNHPNAGGTNLKREVRAVIAEASEHLGFVPRINFRGPVEAAATDTVLSQLIPVVRESLANIGRHAKASSTDVVIGVSDGSITLSVADDGVGVSDEPTAGHGTENMRERAERLGGEFSIRPRKPSGTLVQWAVPITD